MFRYSVWFTTTATLLLPLTAMSAGDSGGGPIPKKLIATGWDSPTPSVLLEHLAEIEKQPFNGVRLLVESKDDQGKRVTFRSLFSPAPWKEEWFSSELAALKKVRLTKLTDNFMSVGPAGGADWFDDAAWKEVLEHTRIGARLAREGGLKGWMFDAEVGRAKPAFDYSRQANKDRYTFDQYAAQARKRGRQMMEVMAREYPGMTLFTLFMSSGTALGAFGTDPLPGLPTSRGYSLYPAFVNGWLDALPPTMTIIDGAEYSYPHSDEAQYLKHVNAVRNSAIAYIAPENRRKFRSQVEAALAIYLDAYVAFPLNNVHSDVLNDPPLREGERLVDRLESSVASAQQFSDQYVWLWGEKYRWWPTASDRVEPQSWEAILPGIGTALQNGMDPDTAALARAEKEFAVTEHKSAGSGRPLKNLITNGGFADGEGWKSTGDATHEKRLGYRSSGAALIKGGTEGTMSQEAAVSPFTFYHLRLRVRQMGKGEAFARLQWVSENGSPVGEPHLLTSKHDPRDAWQAASITLRAPAEAVRLRVELATAHQKTADDVAWFDDVELIPISVN